LTCSKPFDFAVISVDRGGPAARAGLRRGDLIDIRPNTFIERYFLYEVPLNGRALNLSVHSGSLQKELTVVPRAPILTWNFWLAAFAAFWLLLFAILITWRRADVPQMRLLSLWIAALVFTEALMGFAAPWAWAYLFLNISESIIASLSVALLVAASPDSTMARLHIYRDQDRDFFRCDRGSYHAAVRSACLL
jgi:hypothetical protein